MSGTGEKLNAVDGVSAGVIMRPSVGECLTIIGVYHAELIRDGKVIWRDVAPNTVTTQGKNAILDKFLDLGAAYSAIRGIISTTVANAASTYATPGVHVEGTSYSGNRPTPSFSAASSGSKATSSAMAFSITGSMTVAGAGMVLGTSINTPGDTAATAILLSSGAFSGGSRSVISGDTLNVTYSLAL